jgi:colanic acid/amylovoran biosynthesis glycosyltransferase
VFLLQLLQLLQLLELLELPPYPVPALSVKNLAYLFERFPAFTQTFCAREVAELYRQGVKPPVFSIRNTPDTRPVNVPLSDVPVTYLPDTNSIRFKLRTKLVSSKLRSIWRRDNDQRDKNRFYEAVYLGAALQAAQIEHLHVHFAGLAARTAWWIKKLFDIPYSLTGHAKDIFVAEPDQRTPLQRLIQEATFVIAVSDFGADFLREQVPSAASKICRVYNGLDLSIFKPARPESEPANLLSVGRLIEKKGFHELVDACAILSRKGVPQFHCRIVGIGPEQATLQEAIWRNGLEQVVTLVGEKNQNEIVLELAKAQLFVLPCIHDQLGDSDNLPTVIIESMASGLPIVSTKTAGIPELVAHEKNGLLVEEKNSSALAAAIETLLTQPDLRRSYGKESKRRAFENFQVQDTVAQLRRVFETYLS